jgi:hypothetical protein
MLSRIFPKQIHNDYRGYALAIWLLGLVVLARLGMSYGALFDTHEMLQSADSIPVDSFGAAGADAVVLMTKLLGLDHLLLNLVAVVALIRYRAMIPLIYLLLAIEQVARKILLVTNPIARTGTTYLPIDPNVVIIAVLLLGLLLSLGKMGLSRRGTSSA